MYLHSQGTGKHALVDSFDTNKLMVVHRNFINRVVGQKSSEILVREAVDIAFSGFIHNKVILGETNKRIDHRLLIYNTILAIETDEFAHRNKSETQENARYDEFLTKTPYKFVFIRFNCDANRENSDAKTDFQYKLHVLLHNISFQISRIRYGQNIKQLEIWKLFCCAFCADNGRELCTCMQYKAGDSGKTKLASITIW